MLGAREGAIAEVHPRGGLDGGQKIRSQAHRLQDRRHDADRAHCLGLRIHLGQWACRVGLLDHPDSGHDIINGFSGERCWKSAVATNDGRSLVLLGVALHQVLEGLGDVAQSLPDLTQLVAVVSRLRLGPAARDLLDKAGYRSQLAGDSLKGLDVRCAVGHQANVTQPWRLVSTRG